MDFNAGVVAAGEAQIESTVTGNAGGAATHDPLEALADNRQVFLPINNALSPVGHVHGYLEELGQGIQVGGFILGHSLHPRATGDPGVSL